MGAGADVDCGFGGVHRGGPPPRGYFVMQNLDGTGLRFFGVYPLAKPCRLSAKAQRWLGFGGTSMSSVYRGCQ